MSFKPIDAKRDEYRKYLERTGVMEVLSKAIIKLFESTEKPENAVEFIRNNLGDAMLERETIEHLKSELEDSQNEVVQLRRQLESLKLQFAREVPEVMTVAIIQEAANNTADLAQNNEPLPVDANPAPVDISAPIAIESVTEMNERQTNAEEFAEKTAIDADKVVEVGDDKEVNVEVQEEVGDAAETKEGVAEVAEVATNNAE